MCIIELKDSYKPEVQPAHHLQRPVGTALRSLRSVLARRQLRAGRPAAHRGRLLLPRVNSDPASSTAPAAWPWGGRVRVHQFPGPAVPPSARRMENSRAGSRSHCTGTGAVGRVGRVGSPGGHSWSETSRIHRNCAHEASPHDDVAISYVYTKDSSAQHTCVHFTGQDTFAAEKALSLAYSQGD